LTAGQLMLAVMLQGPDAVRRAQRFDWVPNLAAALTRSSNKVTAGALNLA
jgi:hypothetical protein